MPSMFSRKRGNSNPPLDRGTSAAATTAASQAFIHNATTSSSGTLSSSAAAAALRSHTTSPEPVGNIQTKRMVRRGSNSSAGSGSVVVRGGGGGGGRGGLQRSNSGGSMTERTFRSPSPGRPSTNGNMSSGSDVPPVPALPQEIAASASASNGHQRSASMEPPQRITSPTPAKGARGASADRFSLPPPVASRQAKRLSNVKETEADEAGKGNGSPSSRNFSRPMSGVLNSPVTPASASTSTNTAKKYTHGTGSWFTEASASTATSSSPTTVQRPKTSDGVPNRATAGSSSQQQQQQQQQYTRPSLNKLKKNRVSSAPGTHLAQATHTQSHSDAGAESIMVYDANSRTFVSRPKERQTQAKPSSPEGGQVYDPNTRSIVSRSQLPPQPASVPTPTPTPPPRPKKERPAIPAVDTTLKPPPRNPARVSPSPSSSTSPTSPRASGFLHKQPSVVREDREGEEKAETEAASPILTSQKDTTNQRSQPSTATATTPLPPAPPPSKSYTTPTPTTATTTTHQRSASLDVPRYGDSAGRGRNISISPQRPSAHFSSSPVMHATRHVPPPRDVSPAKSALKQQSSSPASSLRTSSPMAMFASSSASTSTAGLKSPPSEASDTTTEDGVGVGGMGKKKKSVRVSFDEQPHEIDAPETAGMVHSPVNDDDDEAEDENMSMKPRPALPSFGSVRRGDRSVQVQPILAEKVTEMPPERNEMVGGGMSSDHAIAGILKNSLQGGGGGSGMMMEAPLPPEVTSKESAAGYVSDESSEAEGPVPEKADGGGPVVKDFADASSSSPVDNDEEKYGDVENGDVPAINLLPPTPGVEDEGNKELAVREEEGEGEGEQGRDEELKVVEKVSKRRSIEVAVPGGWGRDEDEDEEDEAEGEREEGKVVHGEDKAVEPTPSSMADAEPVNPSSSEDAVRRASAEDSAATQTVTPLPVSAPGGSLPSDVDENESDDDDAEFSDAAEELEDEDGGFASLDAILESPAPVVVAEPAWPASAGKTVEGEDGDGDGRTGGDWSQATAYWSQLSKQQREQIEREHLSEDDEEEEEEVRPPPAAVTVKKVKKKKKLVTKPVAAPSQQPVKSSMKKSMRAQPGPASASTADDGVHMRRSMRSDGGGGGGGMMTRMRDRPPPPRPQSAYIEPAPRGTLQKKNLRPVSSSGLSASSAGAAMRPQSSGGLKTQDSAFPALPAKKVERKEPPQVSARLQKELSGGNDSDSESSFKKRRNRGSSMSTMDSQGKYAMRRSMRGAGPVPSRASAVSPEPTSPTPSAAGRGRGSFSIRSLSPTGGFFGRRGGDRKETLRQQEAAGPRTTMRGPPPVSRDAGRGGKGKAVPAPAPAQRSTGAKSGFKSRFGGDSDDDEEDVRPAQRSFFRSRFADSDDEDEPRSSSRVIPADLTPVRGIPRRAGQDDGDSTDLEEEENDDPRKASRRREKAPLPLVPDPADVEKAMVAARRNLGTGSKDSAEPVLQRQDQQQEKDHETKEGEALLKGSLRKPQPQSQSPVVEEKAKPEDIAFAMPEKKKRGFMGSLLRRNRNSSSSVQQLSRQNSPAQQQQQQLVPASPSVAAGPASPSSPASPSVGKLIRRQSDQPRLKRKNSDFSTATPPLPSSTAGSPQTLRKTSESWPLPPPIPEDESSGGTPAVDRDRPSTSDGFSPEAIKLARTMRPDLGGRRSKSGQELSGDGGGGGGGGSRVRILAGEEGSEPGEREKDPVVYSARTGKKKKFGILRRAFGLND